MIKTKKQILGLRKQVNKIDTKLLALLEKRFELCKKIGEYKKENYIPVEDLNREKQIIEDRVNKSNLSKNFIEKLFKTIFKESKKIQEK